MTRGQWEVQKYGKVTQSHDITVPGSCTLHVKIYELNGIPFVEVFEDIYCILFKRLDL